MTDHIEVRVEQPTGFDDRSVTVIAELVGEPSPADGITVTICQGAPKGTVRLHYPRAMVDPRMAAVAQQLLANLTLR